jgi:hypothetical protein
MMRQTRKASSPECREWKDSPVTAALLHYLRQRRDRAVQTYLAGNPVDPVAQGRASALDQLARLLDLSPEQLSNELHKEQY